MSEWLTDVCTALASKGFNLVGIADGQPYEEQLKDCQSAIVFANGGTLFWECFLEEVVATPEYFTHSAHPIDDFVQRCIHSVDPAPTMARRWIQCSEMTDVFVDFRVLAKAAGLGHESPVGLLIHPDYGLWVSMRMVLLTTEKLTHDQTQQTSPCESCVAKPCISNCPAGAVSSTGWSVQKCATFHQESQACEGVCHSRWGCPVGVAHRHSKLQHLYHNARSIGRKELAKRLNVSDEVLGWDPNWSAWS